MKKTVLCILASVFAMTSITLYAADEAKAEKPKKGGTPEERADAMIKRGDKDGDGKLSKEELVALFNAPKKAPGEKKPKS